MKKNSIIVPKGIRFISEWEDFSIPDYPCIMDKKIRRAAMFDITLIAMGKLKEKFYLSAAAEYEKRLKGYCRFQIMELPEFRLPENPSAAEISAGLEKEADLILSKIPKGAWFCVLTPEGKVISSEALAAKV